MNTQINSRSLFLVLGSSLCLSLLFSKSLHAQGIGIGNNTTVTANSSAMLDITAGTAFNRGLLIPRVTYAQRTSPGVGLLNGSGNLAAVCQGLMVYQTDNTNPGEGFYFNTSLTTTPNWLKIGSSAWGLTGNSGTASGTNFIGTTDAQDFTIRAGGAGAGFERMRILSGGNVGIGATAPAVKLAVNGNGVNVTGTDLWIENNMHVQGNEGLTVGGRGRLRVGTAWGYVGLYSDANSVGTVNDLVLGASSGTVRVGPGGTAQKLLLPANTGFQMVDNAGPLKIMISDASGNGTWQPISAAMQLFTIASAKTNITSVYPTYQDVSGLVQSVTLTSNSFVVINTTGSLESDGGPGQTSLCTVSLQRDNIPLQDQATDVMNANGYSQVVQHWAITHTLTLTPGTYVFKVKACNRPGGVSFDAGGADTTVLPSDGALSIEVYPQ